MVNEKCSVSGVKMLKLLLLALLVGAAMADMNITDLCVDKEPCSSSRDCATGEECHPVDNLSYKFCVYGSSSYDHVSWSGDGGIIINLIGDYRSCSQGAPLGCLAGGETTDSYDKCCSGLMYLTSDEQADETCFGRCYQEFANMCKGPGKPCAILYDGKCYCGNKDVKCVQDNECRGNHPVCCRKTGHCSNWVGSWAQTCGSQ
ncbi:hypothetical protein BC940DRAFT_314634 [Gongronella butleri]|nr:hypothetical protein BC940DRAFT_314634 [Gongronella butleri]